MFLLRYEVTWNWRELVLEAGYSGDSDVVNELCERLVSAGISKDFDELEAEGKKKRCNEDMDKLYLAASQNDTSELNTLRSNLVKLGTPKKDIDTQIANGQKDLRPLFQAAYNGETEKVNVIRQRRICSGIPLKDIEAEITKGKKRGQYDYKEKLKLGCRRMHFETSPEDVHVFCEKLTNLGTPLEEIEALKVYDLDDRDDKEDYDKKMSALVEAARNDRIVNRSNRYTKDNLKANMIFVGKLNANLTELGIPQDKINAKIAEGHVALIRSYHFEDTSVLHMARENIMNLGISPKEFNTKCLRVFMTELEFAVGHLDIETMNMYHEELTTHLGIPLKKLNADIAPETLTAMRTAARQNKTEILHELRENPICFGIPVKKINEAVATGYIEALLDSTHEPETVNQIRENLVSLEAPIVKLKAKIATEYMKKLDYVSIYSEPQRNGLREKLIGLGKLPKDVDAKIAKAHMEDLRRSVRFNKQEQVSIWRENLVNLGIPHEKIEKQIAAGQQARTMDRFNAVGKFVYFCTGNRIFQFDER